MKILRRLKSINDKTLIVRTTGAKKVITCGRSVSKDGE